MRRSEFLKLIGVSEEAFDMARARKHLPLRGRVMKRGWQEFTADDALAFEATLAFGRVGVRRADARDVVDAYFDVAFDRASEANGRAVFLGLTKAYAVAQGMPVEQAQFPLVGTMKDVTDEVQRLSHDLGAGRFFDGVIIINLNLCLAVVIDRAANAGLNDDRLAVLASLFGSTASQGESRYG